MTMSNHEVGTHSESVKKLPEGSKAEMIRSGIEERLTEITIAIAEGHPSLSGLELQKVGQRILALFDELLDELPENMENERETMAHSVSEEDLAQGPALIGDNRSKRFWEIDSEIGVLFRNSKSSTKRRKTNPKYKPKVSS